jgi:hypothetical protein
MAKGIFKLRQHMRGVVQKAWTGSLKTNFVEYLLVAGGGSAGSKRTGESGGGGAGGVMQGLTYIRPGTPITVTVGGGGAAAVSDFYQGQNGDNSVFGNLTAIGGGAGAGYANDFSGGVPGAQKGAFPGGSGGGMAQSGEGGNAQGTFRQGNAGGRESKRHVNSAGGGGGAGTVGNDGHGNDGGNGGNGVASYITGTLTTFGGGGAGASQASNIGAIGGEGGGGASHGSNRLSGVNGTVNTGGGSGGGGDSVAPAYAGVDSTGGSGIVVVSYPDVYANAVSTLNGTYSTSGSGSILLNGTTQYLTYPSNAAYAFGTGDFTVEFWIYPTSWAESTMLVYANYSATASTGGLMIGKVGSNFAVRAANVADQLTYGTLPTLNSWTHVVVSRSGTVLSLFYNGTQVATTTNSYNFIQSDLSIGSENAGSEFAGYISNVRAVKGTAVYNPSSSSITVPTAPLTAIPGTSFLLNTVSGSHCADTSTISAAPTVYTTAYPTWDQLSPFATGLGYKNRVYKWTTSGTITF